MGDVRAEQLRLPVQAAAVLPVHAQLEQGLPRVVAAHADPALRRADPDPSLLGSAAEVPPRGAGQGASRASRPTTCASGSRPTSIRCRSTTSRWRHSAPITRKFPLNAVTQRPMAMYHSWDSQNAWLRQIHAHNHSIRESEGRARRGHRGRRLDVGRVAVGQGPLPLQLLRGGRAGHGMDVERDRQGTGRMAPRARRQRIAARVPVEPPDLGRAAGRRPARRSPTRTRSPGQAAWYDVRVRIYPAERGRADRRRGRNSPQFRRRRARPRRRRADRYSCGRKAK